MSSEILTSNLKNACEEEEKKDFLRPFIKQQGALNKEKSRKGTAKIEIEEES